MILTSKSSTAIFVIIISICASCSKVENELAPELDNHNFGIYFLDDYDLKIEDILSAGLVNQDKEALDNIEIHQLPWLTEDDIEMYDCSSHILYLKHNRYDYLPEPVLMDVPASWYYKPFMVVAEGQKRYIGYIAGSFSSRIWPSPVIDYSYNYLYPEDLLIISWQWFNHEETDNRNDSYVMEALNTAGVLHHGLNLELKDVSILENVDTASVQYTYTITNEDEDNLYVVDPDKMGEDLFHRYTIGPQFVKSGEPGTRSASLKKPVSWDSEWDPEWFIKLNSGDSITRTVVLKGYPVFTPGIYQCETTFKGIKKIPKEQRTIFDGRYWIGPTKSNLIYIQYE
jgi:hypothetical protein